MSVRALPKIVLLWLLLVCPLVPVGADVLGELRLFLTSEQRQRLDEKRSGIEKQVVPVVVEIPKPIPRPKPELPPLPRVNLQGYVVRGDGENTVWVNSRALEEGQTIQKKITVLGIDQNTGEARVNLPDQSIIRLKPGQRFEPKGKKIIDPTN